MRSDEQLYDLLVKSDCYLKTVHPLDQAKVAKRRNGLSTKSPSSRIGIVAWELGYRAWLQEQESPPPPPPPPDPTVVAPRTFNPQGGSDARYCVSGLPIDPARGLPFDDFTHYDNNGLDVDGGRDPGYISKKEDGTPLRGAREMDSFGPCDLYDGLTKWPPDSYHR